MARTRSPSRLLDLVDAATHLFAERGYDSTQVADVAAACGVSVGTVYNYVEGKDVLLLLCAERPFRDIAADRVLPISSTDRAGLIAHLEGLLHLVRIPALETALEQPPTRRTLRTAVEAVGRDLYDLLADTRLVADVLERSAKDAPDLSAVFYRTVRVRVIDQLAAFCASVDRVSPLPPALSTDAAARAALETVTWWARHRHRDAEPPVVDEDGARAAAVAVLVRLLAP